MCKEEEERAREREGFIHVCVCVWSVKAILSIGQGLDAKDEEDRELMCV